MAETRKIAAILAADAVMTATRRLAATHGRGRGTVRSLNRPLSPHSRPTATSNGAN
jgi:hypothetical protein